MGRDRVDSAVSSAKKIAREPWCAMALLYFTYIGGAAVSKYLVDGAPVTDIVHWLWATATTFATRPLVQLAMIPLALWMFGHGIRRIERKNESAIEQSNAEHAARLAEFENRRELDLACVRQQILDISVVQTQTAYLFVRQKAYALVKLVLDHTEKDVLKIYADRLVFFREQDGPGVDAVVASIDHHARALFEGLQRIKLAAAFPLPDLPSLDFPHINLRTTNSIRPISTFHASENDQYMEYAGQLLSSAYQFLARATAELEKERLHLLVLEQQIENALETLAHARTS